MPGSLVLVAFPAQLRDRNHHPKTSQGSGAYCEPGAGPRALSVPAQSSEAAVSAGLLRVRTGAQGRPPPVNTGLSTLPHTACLLFIFKFNAFLIKV